MARVTQAEVEAITDIDSSVDVSPFITTANTLIDSVLLDYGHSDAMLTLIELWLSAHFAKILELHPAEERVGAVGTSYQWKLGLNFQVTMYGQQALMLDTSGILMALQEGKGIPKFMCDNISEY